MSLQGGNALRARLKAIKLSFKPVAKAWSRDAVKELRPRVPFRTGRLRRSFRVTSVSSKKARVGGHYTAYFVDKGPKAHDISPRKAGGHLIFQAQGRTIFARKVHHRGYRGRPFRQRAAEEALRKNPLAVEVIKQWNEAA